MKSPLLLEDDVFTEDELGDTQSIISKYFDVSLINLSSALNNFKTTHKQFRGSLAVASLLGYKFSYANALNWATKFRELLFKPAQTGFNNLDYFFRYHDFEKEPLFVRSVSPFKEFPGLAFSDNNKFEREYNFAVRNKNINPDIMCLFSPIVTMGSEYRCVFVNNKYTSGSRYLKGSERSFSPSVPPIVVEFANKIAQNNYFINVPNFIVDIDVGFMGALNLIEINAFETASFYVADLDNIYQALATNEKEDNGHT